MKQRIVIELEGGVIHDIRGLPEDVILEIRDFDTEGYDESEIVHDKDGNNYHLYVMGE